MWKNFGCQSYSNPFYALCQKQGKFYRQRDWLFIPAVIRQFPESSSWIEDYFESKFRKPGFNISRCGRTVSGIYVSPVTLRINQQIFLSQLNQRITNRSITVRMVLHGLAYDVGDLVVSAILNLPHGM